MRYWIWWNDIIQGPFELDELTALRVFSEDLLVCMEDREDWLPAGRVADLSSAMEQARARRGDPIAPPPPPKRPPVVTPLQGEFFGEPPGQQSLLESEDGSKGPYAYRPLTDESDQPHSYLVGQATMPFHFMRQPRTSTSVIETRCPEPSRITLPSRITFAPAPVIKESPVRKPAEEPALEEKIDEKPVISIELLQERPPSLAPILEEPAAAERKLEWLPWIMGVILAIGVLSSMGYWLLDRASTHSAIAEANRLEPPKNLSQKYPPPSVGEGEGGGQVRLQSPASLPSPIKREGVLGKVISALFGRPESPNSSASSAVSQPTGNSRGGFSHATSQSSQSSPAGSKPVWANAISTILSKVDLAATPASSGMTVGQAAAGSVPGVAASSAFQAGSNGNSNSPSATAASRTAYGSRGGSSNASSQGQRPSLNNSWVDSTQLQQSSNMGQDTEPGKTWASSQPAANSSAWAKTVVSILAKVGLAHVQTEAVAGQAAGQAASQAAGQVVGAASGAAASAVLHVGSVLLPTSSAGSHTGLVLGGRFSKASSARPKSLSARSVHKGGKAAAKKKASSHHTPKAKPHIQKALLKNTALRAEGDAETAIAQTDAGSEGAPPAPTAASAVAPAPVSETSVPGKTANGLPGVGAVAPGAAVTPEAVTAVDAPSSPSARPPDPWKGKLNESIRLVMAKTLPKSKITIGNQARALLQQMHEKELLHAAETGERLYLPDKLAWAALQEEGPHYRVYLNFLAWQLNGERVQSRSYQFLADLQRKEVHADDVATQQDLLTQPAELTFKHNPMATDIDSILGGVDTYNKHKVQMIIVKKSSRNRDERKKIETALEAAAGKVRRAVIYFRRTYTEKALQNIAKAYDFMELLKG